MVWVRCTDPASFHSSIRTVHDDPTDPLGAVKWMADIDALARRA
jgi:hypothetical protein